MSPKSTFSLSAVLRKSGPYVLFLLFLGVMLYGPGALPGLLELTQHAPVTATGVNATGAQIALDQQASGWPALGLVAGKLITAAWAYVFFIILRWLTQQLTHPVPTQWAKKGYADAFIALPEGDKFKVYAGIRMNSVLLAAAALLFAALVQ